MVERAPYQRQGFDDMDYYEEEEQEPSGRTGLEPTPGSRPTAYHAESRVGNVTVEIDAIEEDWGGPDGDELDLKAIAARGDFKSYA